MPENINLYTEKMEHLYLRFETLNEIKDELEYILSLFNGDTLTFAKKIVFGAEIKNNNLVEGYNEDLTYIDNLLKNNYRKKNMSDVKSQRVINLFRGYKYIFNNKEINTQSLDELYKILSRNLLCNYDLEHMGKYYREDKVFIYTSSNVAVEPDEGMEFTKIPYYIEKLIEFINEDNHFDSKTDYYIKSQIMHYYFVYIHPYFDVNGITSRTLAMWYLLNNKAYPYLLFNRGINFDKNTYYRAILEVKKYGNITIFIKYMLENVKAELEKEYAILEIEKNAGNISNRESQAINYILTMKGNKTVKDFASFYRRFNDVTKMKDINENIIEPLINKNIILRKETTNSKLYNNEPNFKFELNEDLMDNYNRLIKKK